MKNQSNSGNYDNFFKVIIFSIGIIFALCLFVYNNAPNSDMNERHVNYNDSLLNEDSTILGKKDTCFICSKDSFKQLLIDSNIKCVDEVLRVAIMESGWFKSHIFLTKNNPWGFNNGKEYLSNYFY